ncbi:MAG: hypothetical protein AAFO69_19910, partial [Bacteroidota bacterium]
MNKTTIRWIITLMSFSLIGLIIFQLYWINSVLRANNERFRKDAIEAMNTVALKLEKQELLKITRNKDFKTNFTWLLPNIGGDSGVDQVEMYETKFEKKTFTSEELEGELLDTLFQRLQVPHPAVKDNTIGTTDHRHIEIIFDGQLASSNLLFVNQDLLDSSKEARERINITIQKTDKKAEMASNIFLRDFFFR